MTLFSHSTSSPIRLTIRLRNIFCFERVSLFVYCYCIKRTYFFGISNVIMHIRVINIYLKSQPVNCSYPHRVVSFAMAWHRTSRHLRASQAVARQTYRAATTCRQRRRDRHIQRKRARTTQRLISRRRRFLGRRLLPDARIGPCHQYCSGSPAGPR